MEHGADEAAGAPAKLVRMVQGRDVEHAAECEAAAAEDVELRARVAAILDGADPTGGALVKLGSGLAQAAVVGRGRAAEHQAALLEFDSYFHRNAFRKY
jgi:hypothetical protein